MRKAVGLALVSLMILAAIGAASPALAAGDGVVSGQVINKTPGGSPVGTLEVTLERFSNGQAASVLYRQSPELG